MPGGGVRSTNINQLIKDIGVTEFHSSAIVNNNNRYLADEMEIKALIKNMQ